MGIFRIWEVKLGDFEVKFGDSEVKFGDFSGDLRILRGILTFGVRIRNLGVKFGEFFGRFRETGQYREDLWQTQEFSCKIVNFLGNVGDFWLKFGDFGFLSVEIQRFGVSWGEFFSFGVKFDGISLFLIAKFWYFHDNHTLDDVTPQLITSLPPKMTEISQILNFFRSEPPSGTHVLIPLGSSSPTG